MLESREVKILYLTDGVHIGYVGHWIGVNQLIDVGITGASCEVNTGSRQVHTQAIKEEKFTIKNGFQEQEKSAR